MRIILFFVDIFFRILYLTFGFVAELLSLVIHVVCAITLMLLHFTEIVEYQLRRYRDRFIEKKKATSSKNPRVNL